MTTTAHKLLLLGQRRGPVLITITAPSGFISDTTPDIEWTTIPGAEDYTVRVYDIDENLVFEDTEATSPVTVSPALDPLDGPFTIQVNANPNGPVAEAMFGVYVLYDDFPGDVEPPIESPRTANPGPGELTIADSANTRFQIVDGVIGPIASPQSGDVAPQIRYDTGISRAAGWAFFHRTRRNPIGPGPNENFSPVAGWNTSATNTFIGPLTIFGSGSGFRFAEGSTAVAVGLVKPESETFYEFVHILRSTGVFTFINGKLAYIHSLGSNATMYPVVAHPAAFDRHTPDVDYFKVVRLGGPWNDDYGYATSRLGGARNENDTFSHEAGAFWLEFTCATLPNSGSITIDIRRFDADNKWQLEVTSAGGFNLNEVISGVPTTRVSLTGVQNGNRLKLVMDGEEAQLFRVGSSSSIGSGTIYTSVSSLMTETNGIISSLGTGGAISDLETYPVYPSGEALSWLNF